MNFDATNRIGSFLTVEADGLPVHAYVPPDLPFLPVLQLGPRIQELLQEARDHLARLDYAGDILPDREQLYSMYIRKEAVLTSQIEGTQSTLEDLLRFEGVSTEQLPSDDVKEMLNYV